MISNVRLGWWIGILLLIVFVWACNPAESSVHYIKRHHKTTQCNPVCPLSTQYTRAFVPTHAGQLAQNAEIDHLGLHRFKDDRELRSAVREGSLVPLPTAQGIVIARQLPANRRYIRPWVVDFLLGMASGYYLRFGVPLQVNSAVRTERIQRNLRHWNPNAAPIHGESASSHLAGTTVDLARRGLSKEQVWWIEGYLLGIGSERVIVFEETNSEACFHIFIIPSSSYKIVY